MKRITLLLPIIILLTLINNVSYGQVPTCDASVPFYVVDLRGQPTGSWVSPAFSRVGFCCGASGSTGCASFQLLLDSNTAMVDFEIASGAIPSGVMYYQIDCGASVPVGSPICITGGSNHYLTFCKPGNNTNTYRVTAISKPKFPNDDSARIGCTRLIAFRGMQASSVTWTSIYPGAAGAYNSQMILYDSTHLQYTPAAGAPPYVDYRICGTPQATSCGYLSFCDTFRVYNFSALSATMSPAAPTFCIGGNGVTITPTVSGGAAPYTFTWKNSGGTTVGTSSTYTANVAGTYSLEIRDALYNASLCPGFVQTVNVTSANTPVVNAGADQILCASAPLTHLGGSVTYATGIWTGGAGTFSAGATSPVTDYTPSPGELTTGYADLILTSTGAGGGCVNKSDTVHIIYSPIVNLAISNNAVLCNGGNTGSATASVTGGHPPFSYSWSTAPVQTTPTATGLILGTYSVTVTDSRGCNARSSTTVTQPDALTTEAATLTNVSCYGGNNGSATVTPAGGTTPYSYKWSSSPVQRGATATALPAGTYTVTVTDANSCISTASVTVTQPTLLTTTAATLTNVSCNGVNDGSASVAASGGTAPYTYNWNSSPAQSTPTATGLPARTYTVTVTDAQGCTKSAATTITQPSTLNAVATTTANVSCNGGSNGAALVSPSGGTTPYTFSWTNMPEQTTAAANGLPAGVYTVTVTDAHSCTKTVTATITQPPALVTSAVTVSNAQCNGVSTGSVKTTPSGGTTPYTYSWNTAPVQTTSVASGLVAGTYSVVVTDAHSCTVTATATVTQPSTLEATASTLADVLCNGGNNGSVGVIATGGTVPYTYSWNTFPVQTGANASALTAGDYVVTVKDAQGCSSTARATVTQPSALTATASTLTNVACFGGNDGSINVTASGGTTPYTYTWSTAPVQSTATATGLVAGSYMVTVNDAHGCSRTSAATVTQPTLLTATANTLTNALCNGVNTGSVGVIPAGGTVPYTYSWSTIPAQTTNTASDLMAGTYTVTVTDAHNCSVTASSTVTQPSTLAATASTLTNVSCNGGNNGSVSVVATGGTAPYNYSWNTVPGQTTSAVSGLTAGTYVVMVGDAHDCSVMSTTIVTEPTVLEATASTVTNVSCNAGVNGSAQVLADGGTTPYTYYWSTSPAQTTSAATGLVAGSYTATVTDAHGCSLSPAVVVTEPTTLTATTVVLSNVSCNGGANGLAVVLPAGGTIPYKYSWTTAPIQDSATAIGLVAGTYTANVSDNNGCVTAAIATITEPTALTATAATLANVLCNGGNNGSVNVVPGGGTLPYTYSWNATPAQTTATATGLTAGTYTATVSDSNGCSVNAITTITEPPVLSVSSSSTGILCNGDIATILISAKGGTIPYEGVGTYTVNAGMYNYLVTDADGCKDSATVAIAQPDPLSVTANATDASCDAGNDGKATIVAIGGTLPYTYLWDAATRNQTTATATDLSKGTYEAIVIDHNGCSKTAVVVIKGDVSTLALGSSVTNPLCFNDNNGSVNTYAIGGTPPYTFGWSTGSTDISLSGLAPGEYRLIVTDAAGCSTSETYTITQPSPRQLGLVPMIYPTGFNVSEYGAFDGSIKAEIGGGSPGYTYLWSTGSTDQMIDKLPAGTYSVIVTDQNGCTDTASVVLNGPVLLELPMGYSPNGDGKNDYFVIHGINAYPNNQLLIFNRWGNEVYSADGYHNTWNGKNKNDKDLPDGTYFVILSINGGAITRQGYVDLRR